MKISIEGYPLLELRKVIKAMTRSTSPFSEGILNITTSSEDVDYPVLIWSLSDDLTTYVEYRIYRYAMASIAFEKDTTISMKLEDVKTVFNAISGNDKRANMEIEYDGNKTVRFSIYTPKSNHVKTVEIQTVTYEYPDLQLNPNITFKFKTYPYLLEHALSHRTRYDSYTDVEINIKDRDMNISLLYPDFPRISTTIPVEPIEAPIEFIEGKMEIRSIYDLYKLRTIVNIVKAVLNTDKDLLEIGFSNSNILQLKAYYFNHARTLLAPDVDP